MKSFLYKIKSESGIHARPAGLLIKKASEFTSEITISKNGKTADAKKIFAVMSLGAKMGDEITITVNGSDEDEAYKAIETFFNENGV